MSAFKLDDLLKIGTEALQTTAQTLCGAVNELKAAITSINSSITDIRKDAKQYYGTVGNSTAYWYYLFDNPVKVIPGTYYLEKTSVALSTSDVTVVTFTGLDALTNPDFDVSISEWISPESGAFSNGTYTLTLPKVDTATTVTVRLYVRPYGPIAYSG